VGAALLAIVVSFATYCSVAERWALSKECANYMLLNLGLEARVWAGDNGHRMPTNYECMKDGMVPSFWVCPAEGKGNPLWRERSGEDWPRFRPELASYEIVAPGIADTETNAAFLRCKIHGHICYVDGSVSDGVKRRWPQDFFGLTNGIHRTPR
jgi:hypothetical protein